MDALTKFAQESNGGLIVAPAPSTFDNRDLIVALAARLRLPAVYSYRFFVTSGGLVSYGIDGKDLWRAAAVYVDRILRGKKPGDLPVQLPTKESSAINLKGSEGAGHRGVLATPAAGRRSARVTDARSAIGTRQTWEPAFVKGAEKETAPQVGPYLMLFAVGRLTEAASSTIMV